MEAPSAIDTSGTPDQVAQWIWKNLVPKAGQAASLQGELIRAIEKLRWEAQGNGNINWDDRFEMFVDFLRDHLLAQDFFSHDEKSSMTADLDRLTAFITPDQLAEDHSRDHLLPYVGDDLYDRLTAHVVKFCRHFPQIIPRQPDPRQYR